MTTKKTNEPAQREPVSMTAQAAPATKRRRRALRPEADPTVGLASVNEVHLVGRVSAPATERELPSGDVLTSFRVVVHRVEPTRSGRRVVDAIDCHAWTARVRKQAAGWMVGDVVELEGSLRRRFFRAGGATQSMTEVEVTAGRIVTRAGS